MPAARQTLSHPEAPPAAEPAAGLDPARLERQLDRLDRLADLGVEIAEGLAAQAKGTGPQVVEGDLALAYDRVSRAVRMATALQSRLMMDFRQAPAQTPAGGLPAAGPGPAEQARARKDGVARIIHRVAEGQGGLEGFQVSWLAREARERLEHDDIYGQVMTQPVSELVARICDDLGLTPKWKHLALEAWAEDEIEGGAPGAPLQALLDEGFWDDDGGPQADDPPPDAALTAPTLDDRLQELARDPEIRAVAGRPSG